MFMRGNRKIAAVAAVAAAAAQRPCRPTCCAWRYAIERQAVVRLATLMQLSKISSPGRLRGSATHIYGENTAELLENSPKW